jgi:hypothetical protein
VERSSITRCGTTVSLLPENSQILCRARLPVASMRPRPASRSVIAISWATLVELCPKQPNGAQLHVDVAVRTLPCAQ